jgi:ATP-dependent RNA helicase DDX23/PRP28
MNIFVLRPAPTLVRFWSPFCLELNFCRRDDRYRDERSRYGGGGSGERAAPREPPPHQAAPAPPPPPPDDANGAGPKKDPLSLEELLRRKKAEAEAQARPVFLTKAQRQEQALARRREEAGAQRADADALRHGLAAAAGRGAAVAPSRDYRDARDGRPDPAERERQRQLEAIKAQYLGAPKAAKKPPPKASDKFKFVFDWDASEDTTRGANPAFQNTHEASLLFGRGFRAGIDRREQKKASAAAEADAARRSRAASGAAETRGEREAAARRAGAADRYDGGDMRVDTHWSEKPLARMTERDWRIFREDFAIAYKGATAGAALPVRSWDEAGLPPSLRSAVDKAGYKKPSPIQMAAIPLGVQQRDVIGIAETGSGKTAAFVLPMLMYILRQPPMLGNPEVEAEGPYAVILAPTRELAQQIEEEARSLAAFTPFRVVSVVGGQSIEDQGFLLRKGCEVVVATPGRLVDCIERRYAVLNQCNYVVLDEADRMIDLGFEPQVMGVLDAMPSSNLKPEGEGEELEAARVYRTTYMFSATMPPAVERLARKYLRRPVVVTIGTAGRATDNVTQRVAWCKENEKAALLARELAAAGDGARVIVFANTQKKVEQVVRAVEGLGYAAAMLHGGKTQDQREDSIKGFREDRYNVLVATDVAGRGIDVANVALVVNFDMPHTIEAYTHRIGRTGRAGKKGEAVVLLTPADAEVFFDLKKFLEDANAAVPHQLAAHEASRQKPGGEGRRPSVQFAKK